MLNNHGLKILQTFSMASRQNSYVGKLGKSSQVLGPPPELGKIKNWKRYEKITPPPKISKNSQVLNLYEKRSEFRSK